MAFYAVKRGRDGPAIYNSWDRCKEATNGFPGAKFKRFEIEDEAKAFAYGKTESLPDKQYDALIYTDGSFLQDKRGGYAAVFVVGGAPFGVVCGPSRMPAVIRNIGGEIEAAEEAIMKAIELGYKAIKIFHDYEGVGSWATGEWARNKQSTIEYNAFIQEKKKLIRIDFEKVEGHSGNYFNDVADVYAKKGALANDKLIFGFGMPFFIEGVHKKPKRVRYVCPDCGATVHKEDAYCMTCGVIFDEDKQPVQKEGLDVNETDVNVPVKVKCHVCGATIEEGSPKYSVEVYLSGKKQRVDCCCEKCAKQAIDTEVERLALAYEEIASQTIVIR